MKTLADQFVDLIVDHLIATTDATQLKTDLERAHFSYPFDGQHVSYLQKAVRRVTDWEKVGAYKIERAKLIKGHVPIYIPELDPTALAVMGRLTRPYQDADQEGKKRIDLLFNFIQRNRLWDVAALMFKPAKKSAGRKQNRKYPDDVGLLVEMKHMVEGGSSVAAAAKKVATRARGQSPAAKQDRLENAYRISAAQWKSEKNRRPNLTPGTTSMSKR